MKIKILLLPITDEKYMHFSKFYKGIVDTYHHY